MSAAHLKMLGTIASVEALTRIFWEQHEPLSETPKHFVKAILDACKECEVALRSVRTITHREHKRLYKTLQKFEDEIFGGEVPIYQITAMQIEMLTGLIWRVKNPKILRTVTKLDNRVYRLHAYYARRKDLVGAEQWACQAYKVWEDLAV